MRRALGLVVLIPFFTLGCGDDTGTNGTPDAPMVDARPIDARIDAPPIDAPMIDADNSTPTTPNTVVCGLSGEQCNITNHYCCTIFGGGGLPTFECITDGVDAGSPCSAEQRCDGTEDCSSGQICCGQGNTGGGVTQCKTACATGETQVCHNHGQCPSAAPLCCTGSFAGFMLPFGGCFATAPANTVCDTP
jgi:hypothetical protein